MNWAHLVFYAFTAVGAVGFCLMTAAYALAFYQRKRDPDAAGTLPRRLLLAGAALGVVFGVGLSVCLNTVGAPWEN